VNPAFFSPKNAGLIREFKALSAHGVLRLGEVDLPASSLDEPSSPTCPDTATLDNPDPLFHVEEPPVAR
jgi:hypothetical protein